MNHVMLDIETLGQGPDAVITSIAAVQFDLTTGEIGKIFRKDVNIDSNTKLGRKIDNSTLLWWMNQSTDAIKGLAESLAKGSDLPDVLKDLSLFFYTMGLKDIYVWGRGPRFDQAILTHAYTSLERDIPWSFRNELCVRSMEFLLPKVKEETEKVDSTGHGADGGGLHDPCLDAKYQIAYVSAIYNALMKGYTTPIPSFSKEAIIKAAENVSLQHEAIKDLRKLVANIGNDYELGASTRSWMNTNRHLFNKY